jgi:hypothetical protein
MGLLPRRGVPWRFVLARPSAPDAKDLCLARGFGAALSRSWTCWFGMSTRLNSQPDPDKISLDQSYTRTPISLTIQAADIQS